MDHAAFAPLYATTTPMQEQDYNPAKTLLVHAGRQMQFAPLYATTIPVQEQDYNLAKTVLVHARRQMQQKRKEGIPTEESTRDRCKDELVTGE